jgi:adenosylcobinamide-GDP ribazoletransferase
MLGGILVGLKYGLDLILPSAVVHALLIAALVIMTGAHHIDGLIDTFDGTVFGKSRDEKLKIMGDNHVGAFGITAAILVILVKYVSLSSTVSTIPALLLMPILSRWVVVSTIFTFPYAKNTGMGTAFKQGARWYRLTIATIIALLAAFLLLGWWGILLLAVLWLIIFGFASYLRFHFGGLTGDSYGAIIETAEVSVLILIMIPFWRF